MSTAQRYYLSIDDLGHARGPDPDLSFNGSSPQSFAEALQQALRETVLFQRWRAKQPDPEDVDESLAPVDPAATVSAHQDDLHAEVEVVTSLPHAILRHRLNLLVGHRWKLRDVRAA
ncbi:MAG TPA: hypothetical protein VN725_02000 [Rhodanobacteraceae bacterium]|nr:hypothetical protein [Rhodanobacteraceae bacterium]